MHDDYRPGLEGVIAAETRLSKVDGEAGELTLAGFPLEELASRASFEETVHLLWHLELPDSEQLASLRGELAQRRALPAATLDLLQEAARRQVPTMDALRMAAATASLEHPSMPSDDPAREHALRLVATFPTFVAAYWRLLQGQDPVPPDPDLDHAANYLFMLEGARPQAGRVAGLATYLNTVVDHGMNASTFTARVIVSTQSDLVSAIVGAVGALKGPLHGGAPGPALDMVFEIGKPERAEPYLRAKLERGERLMGFGHRVYKVRDPRAEVLAAAARHLFADGEQRELYELACHVEKTALALLKERKPGRRLQTNVEYYTALLLHGVGLPSALFTPTFAVGRVGGWTAHCFEQLAANRLIRPRASYVGTTERRWIPLAER